MGDLSKNISRSEVKCKCGKCNYQTVDFELVEVIQDACDYFSKKYNVPRVALAITSAHRCPAHNAAVGGAPNSFHVLGCAIDHYIVGVKTSELYEYYCSLYPDKFGIGFYADKGFVHIDTGDRKWRR